MEGGEGEWKVMGAAKRPSGYAHSEGLHAMR
jgi:hypothetical protein